MASCTLGVSTGSTSNLSSYVSGSFTPAAGDLLVVATLSSGVTGQVASLTASANGITFTQVDVGTRASLDDMQLWVADQLVPASPSAMTLTYNPGAAATGAFIAAARVAGVTRTSVAAIRQHVVTVGSGTAISASFGAATLTTNPVLSFYEGTNNPAAVTQPGGWTEQDDTGFGSPTRGWEWATIDSGYTSATVSATGPTGTWVYGLIEVDTSAGATTVSGADTGTGANAATLAAAVTGLETGAGIDAGTLAAALTGADTAVAVDAATVSTGSAVNGSDTGTGVDAAALAAVPTTATDTGAGADAASLTAAPAAADTGTAANAATVTTAPTAADAGTGTDAGTLATALTATDTGAAVDTATVQAGSNVSGGDTAHAVDAATVMVLITATDNASATDLAALAATVSAADLAHALDAGAAAPAVAARDITATATAPTRRWSVTTTPRPNAGPTPRWRATR
jgi:hypothetical protein